MLQKKILLKQIFREIARIFHQIKIKQQFISDRELPQVYFNIYIYNTYFASPPVGSPKVEKVKKGHNAEDFSRFMIHDPGLEMGQRRSEEIMPKEHVNSEIDIKVKALSVILNHSNYEVAHAMVK